MKASVNEITPLVLENRIEKIYQPKPYELFLKVRGEMIFISAHPTLFRIQGTNLKPQNPATPFMFCMTLRKHLTGGRIKDIDMQGKERIVCFTIENTDELYEKAEFRLICELMGKHSNVILVDKNDKIIDSMKKIPLSVSSVRQILPGETYVAPPTRDMDSPYFGMSRFLREQIEAGKIQEQQVLDAIDNPKPVIVNHKQPLILPIPEEENQSFDTISSMLDEYYSEKKDEIKNHQLIKNLQTIISRANKKIEIHQKNLVEDESVYKLFGELLTSFNYSIEKGASQAKLINYYDNQEVVIPLDKMLTASQNAQNYYKKYNKKKTAKIYAQEQIEKTLEEIAFLEESILYLQRAQSEAETEEIKNELYSSGFLKKYKKKAKVKIVGPIVYQTDNGAEIWVGRNSLQNDQLTLKKANKKYLWFHVKDIPGSHVILTNNLENEDSILQAAKIAAYYSKAKDSTQVPVDYTEVKYVHKPAHSLPGKVIYTNQRTLFVTPDLAEIKEFSKEQE